MKQSFYRYCSLTLIVIISFCCTSWGFLVHRSVNQLAVYLLPNSMAVFFHQNLGYLVKESVRADLRRDQDSLEAPKHFVDFEAYDPDQLGAWKMPFKFEEAVAKYGKDSLSKYGYLPYQVIESKNRLTAAFKSWDKDSILFHAADLAHYVADAHVPLHTTLNYDGQLTGQPGLHSLWESMMPELYIDQFELYTPYKVTYLKDPEQAIWGALRSSYLLVDDMLKKEELTAKNFPGDTKYRIQVRNGKTVKSYNTEFAKAYYQRIGKSVNAQLLLAVNLVADFWYTSWVDAGEPSLEIISDKNVHNMRDLRAEKIYHKKNTLIRKQKLIAKKNTDSETKEKPVSQPDSARKGSR
ncbi:zinc dependent phospholipase C family protein [Flavitalea antarctica]